MCGICGFTGEILDREQILKSMTDVIVHRGPNSEGFFSTAEISMGFRRLSIIDLAEGNQPIFNEDKTLVLTFNGEIYNYKELRTELLSAGHKFVTNTDSEVLIHGFEEWQEGLLNRLRGMFAFAIFNTVDGSLFLARDFFGIKPLHYTIVDGQLVYGSEIKSILQFPKVEKKFNRRALDKYLSFQYSVPPETFFENIFCLLPGHYAWFKDDQLEITRYFEATFEPDENSTLDEAVEKIESAFEESVIKHKESDVEVGCFLSSGVDSSYVSTYFAGQKAFTVGFDSDEMYNEIGFAKGLAEKIGLEHYSKVISDEEFWSNIAHVQYIMDQPLADPSCIALYFVSKLASDHVKVVLSGEGADELFGGYNIYHEPLSLRRYQKIPRFFRRALAAIVEAIPANFIGKNFIIRGSKELPERFIGNAFMFSEKDKKQLLKDSSLATAPQEVCEDFYRKSCHYDDVTRMQHLDINLWMVGDILLKADRMSMANSLELRVPFLDKELFKVARTLPSKLKVNNENTKFALRRAALKHLPQLTANKKKLGFPVPTRVWLRQKKYYNIVKEMFCSDSAKKFFNVDVLISYLDEHFQNKADNSRKIWTVYVFLVWYNVYFD